jgi:hypothetical protein
VKPRRKKEEISAWTREIEGKVARIGASEPRGERVSIKKVQSGKQEPRKKSQGGVKSSIANLRITKQAKVERVVANALRWARIIGFGTNRSTTRANATLNGERPTSNAELRE